MTNNHIIGIRTYIDTLVDKLIDNGPENKTDWKHYMAYGSWVSLTLKTAWSQVKFNVERWGYTRFLAAKMRIEDNMECSDYLAVLNNDTLVADTCFKFPFDDDHMQGVYYFALAEHFPDVKSELLAATNLTESDLTKIYSTNTTWNNMTKALNMTLSAHYTC